MDYAELNRRKHERRGKNSREREMKRKSKEFYEYFDNTLNREECLIDGVKEIAVFQDHSQSNNKDLSDDKYIVVPNEVNIEIGSYVTWRDQPWLVFTEEFKTIPSHQQLKIKIVNENIKWIRDKKICNEGNGWGAYVQNQTLYTLGIARQGNHLDLVNSKMMLYMKNNEETRNLKTGERIFVGFTVYKIMFRDGVSRKGLINYLLEEDTLKSTDNTDLKIADYYEKENVEPEDPNPEDAPVITGDARGRLGGVYTYRIQDGFDVDEWIVDTGGSEIVEIYERTSKFITMKINDLNKNVGLTVSLMAKVGDVYSQFAIRIATKY